MMRKVLLTVLAVTALSVQSIQAQNKFDASLAVGIPIGDASDVTTFTFALGAEYLFGINEKLFIGPEINYWHFFGEEINGFEIDDIQFLPIAAGVRKMWTDEFFTQGNIGYAIGINDGNDGGLFLSPEVGYMFSEEFGLALNYRNVSNDGNHFAALMLRAIYSFQ